MRLLSLVAVGNIPGRYKHADDVLQTTHGCGDLLFSSHTTFALVGVMSYQEYGTLNAVKVRAPCVQHKSTQNRSAWAWSENFTS